MTEETIHNSEERFRELFDSIRNGVAVYEAKDGGQDFIIKDLNRAGQNIDKIQKQDVLGKSILEIFPGVKKFGLFDVLERVFRTGQAEYYPTAFYRDDRISGWRENYVYKLSTGEIVAVYEDVTEQKNAEESLQLFRRLLDESSDAVSIVNPESGKFLDVNARVCEFLGHSRDQLLQMHIYDIEGTIPDLKAWQEEAERLKKEGQKTITVQPKRQDGLQIVMEINLSYIQDQDASYIVSIGRDITERKKIEEEIRELAKFPVESPHPVCRITKDGQVLYANGSAECLFRAFRCPLNQVEGEMLRQVQETFRNNKIFESEIYCENCRKTFSYTMNPFPDAGYINIYALDISDRKKMEQELTEHLRDLQQFKEITIDRENVMINLKKEVNKLSVELGRPEPYDLSFLEPKRGSFEKDDKI